ncbi:zinc finger protein 90 [Trichonephila clavipes]|nr:zinc finger protein 90 [Trichonephila clavipes]
MRRLGLLSPIQSKDETFDLPIVDASSQNYRFRILIDIGAAFARSTVELSAAATEHHRIHLQHDNPIKCPIYKIPFNLRNEFRRQIADLEKAGIISKSKSQYNTPALFVKQKEKWRLVLDFTKLNEITQDFAMLQEAFDDIKEAILNPSVLALPDPNAELQITTDASSRGIGAVLEQKYPNSEVKP